MVFKCMSFDINSTLPLSFNSRLEGKVAIITGGASGIGATSVKLFHDSGAKVVIADVKDQPGQALADKLGEDVCYIHCDVSNEEDIINVVDTTVAKYGKLDIMYNNAGLVDRSFGSILDTPKSNLERLLAVNVVGGFLGAKHAARVMLPQRKGCILFAESSCGVSKYGILDLVKNLTAELGQYGIRVNCVSPYALITRMSSSKGVDPAKLLKQKLSKFCNLRRQVLKTENINAALYLASDEASSVSGQYLVVDGGFSVVNPTLIRVLNVLPRYCK